MEYIVNLHPDVNNLLNFESLLSKWKEFKTCLRDIKINTILGQKCLYEVEDLNPRLFCEFSEHYLTNLSKSAIAIKKLSFKIDSDLTIIELKLTYNNLDTKMGKVMDNLISSGISLNINPIVRTWRVNQSNQVTGFFIEIDSD